MVNNRVMRVARYAAAIVVATTVAPAGATVHPLVIPFDFENNQILVRAATGNSGSAWFLLDSGSSACVIDAMLAHGIGLKICNTDRPNRRLVASLTVMAAHAGQQM